MILYTQSHYVWLNINTSHHIYIKDEKDLITRNQEGYNIYFIANDFWKNRSIKELVAFKHLAFDIDSKALDDKELLGICQTHLWFLPCKINETYKGYHILFRLDEDLVSLDSSTYYLLYNYINDILGWDNAMKDITGIFKVAGYKDHKEGRDYLIEERYTGEHILTKKNIESLNISLEFDNKRIERYNESVKKKQRNKNLFENIDPHILIQEIQKEKELFSFPLTIQSNGTIDNTSGLKIHWDKTKYVIKDFTDKKRYGNYNFFFRYILREKLQIDKREKAEKDTLQRDIFQWLKNTFSIGFNKNLDEEPIVDSFFIYNLEKKTLVINQKVLNASEPFKKIETFDEDSSEYEFNKQLVETKDADFLHRLAASVNHLAIKTEQNTRQEIVVKEKDLLESLGWSEDYKAKKKLRWGLLLLSSLMIGYDKNIIQEGILKGRTEKRMLRLFDLILIEDPGKTTYYKIKINFSSVKKIWFDPKLLQNKNTLFLARIKEVCQRFGKYEDSLETVFQISGRQTIQSLHSLLNSYKLKNTIREFSIKDGRVIIKA